MPNIEETRLRAENGDAKAQRSMGRTYLHGNGVTQNIEEAVRWFTLAAEHGDADAQTELGWICRMGCCSKNHEEAKKWYGLAAAQGQSYAAGELKKICAEETDITKDNEVNVYGFSFNECAVCGRVSGIGRSWKTTTFAREGISVTDHGGTVPAGGSISIVKKVRSSDCGHRPAERIEDRPDLIAALNEEQTDRIVADRRSVTAVRRRPRSGISIIDLRSDEDMISVSHSTKGSPGHGERELTEEEFGEHIKILRNEYESIFSGIRRSTGKFDWKNIIKEGKEGRKSYGTERTNEKRIRSPGEGTETDPVSFYRCAYCGSRYLTEENARRCAVSCREKRTAYAKEYDTGYKSMKEEDEVAYRPWRCTLCQREHRTEDEAGRCWIRCKDITATNWGGRILMSRSSLSSDLPSSPLSSSPHSPSSPLSSSKDIWIIKKHSYYREILRAIHISISPDRLRIEHDAFFDPLQKDEDATELTEDEFLEQAEQIYSQGSALLDDLLNSRGNFDWKTVTAKDV